MAAQSFCKEMFPTMDAVMPGGSCLTAFAKKKGKEKTRRLFCTTYIATLYDLVSLLTDVLEKRLELRDSLHFCSVLDRAALVVAVMIVEWITSSASEQNIIERIENIENQCFG